MASERPARASILAIGRIEQGQVVILTKHHQIDQLIDSISDADWARYEALPPLQEFIDYGAELAELEDDIADRAYWASGNW